MTRQQPQILEQRRGKIKITVNDVWC